MPSTPGWEAGERGLDAHRAVTTAPDPSLPPATAAAMLAAARQGLDEHARERGWEAWMAAGGGLIFVVLGAIGAGEPDAWFWAAFSAVPALAMLALAGRLRAKAERLRREPPTLVRGRVVDKDKRPMGKGQHRYLLGLEVAASHLLTPEGLGPPAATWEAYTKQAARLGPIALTSAPLPETAPGEPAPAWIQIRFGAFDFDAVAIGDEVALVLAPDGLAVARVDVGAAPGGAAGLRP